VSTMERWGVRLTRLGRAWLTRAAWRREGGGSAERWRRLSGGQRRRRRGPGALGSEPRSEVQSKREGNGDTAELTEGGEKRQQLKIHRGTGDSDDRTRTRGQEGGSVGRARSLAWGMGGEREKLNEGGASSLLRWGGIGEKQWGVSIDGHVEAKVEEGAATGKRHDRNTAAAGMGSEGQCTVWLQNMRGETTDEWGHTAQHQHGLNRFKDFKRIRIDFELVQTCSDPKKIFLASKNLK
jgi:hypothetical protein